MRLKEKMVENRSKLIRTFAVCLSFIGLGASMTVVGSSLLDIQIRVGRTFAETSRLLMVKSSGYFLGGLLGISYLFNYLILSRR